MRHTMKVCLGLLLGLMMASAAQAITYYVSPTGLDSNNCSATIPTARDISTPKLTLNNAIACMAAGDTLILRNGTYVTIFTQNLIPSGLNAGAHTIIRAENPLQAIIKPANSSSPAGIIVLQLNGTKAFITIDGLKFDGTSVVNTFIQHVQIQGTANNITVKNCEITGGIDNGQASDSHAFWIGEDTSALLMQNNIIHDIGYPHAGASTGTYAVYWRSSNSTFERNHVYNVSGYTIHMYGAVVTLPSNNVIRWNNFHNNGDQVLLSSGGNNNLFYGNIVRNSGAKFPNSPAVKVNGWGGKTATGNKVMNNVIYSNAGSCIELGSPMPATDSTVVNNICYSNAMGNTVVRSNVNGTTVDTPNITVGDPLFVNAGAADFHLRAESPAIDTGVNTAIGMLDIDGIAFGTTSVEQGAYVYGGAPIVPLVLAFTVPPSSANVGQTLFPAVKVCAVDSVGTPQASFSANITLTLTTGTGVLTGGTATAPVTGCSTFPGLSISADGVKRLTAAATGATSIISNDFPITLAAAVGSPDMLRLLYAP